MSDGAALAPIRCPLWRRLLLGISLAINLLIAGLAVGAALRFGPEGAGGPPRSLGGLMYRELPKEDRAAVYNNVQTANPVDHWKRRATEAHEISVLLRADPLDVVALEALVTSNAQSRQAWQQSMQVAWIERVAAMATQDRLEYADRMEKAASHRHGPKGGKDKTQKP